MHSHCIIYSISWAYIVVVNVVVTASPSTSAGCFDLCLNAFPNYFYMVIIMEHLSAWTALMSTVQFVKCCTIVVGVDI